MMHLGGFDVAAEIRWLEQHLGSDPAALAPAPANSRDEIELMPHNKTILVLAASPHQIPLIQAAIELGYRVCTADNRPENPGHLLADKSFNVDITDEHAILQVARNEAIDGIVAAATDVGVPTAAYVARELNLTGVPWESATTVCDKAKFLSFLRRNGLRARKSYEIASAEDLDPKVFDRQRWIVKPRRSSGSKGVFVVDSLADLRQRIPETKEYAPEGTFLLEKFIVGRQHTCEGFLQEGAPRFWTVTDRQTMAEPYVTTCGHHVPTRLSDAMQRSVVDQLSVLFAKLRIHDGPFDCDFVVNDGEVYILELSPRIGGNSIARLLQRAVGINLLEASAKLACADSFTLDWRARMCPTAVVLFGADREGILRVDVVELERLRREPWVDSLTLDVAPGTAVQAFKNSRCCLGEAIVVGSNREELDQRVEDVRRRLGIRVE